MIKFNHSTHLVAKCWPDDHHFATTHDMTWHIMTYHDMSWHDMKNVIQVKFRASSSGRPLSDGMNDTNRIKYFVHDDEILSFFISWWQNSHRGFYFMMTKFSGDWHKIELTLNANTGRITVDGDIQNFKSQDCKFWKFCTNRCNNLHQSLL